MLPRFINYKILRILLNEIFSSKSNPNFHSSSKNEYELVSFRVTTFRPCLAAGSHGERLARAVEMKTINILGRRKKVRFEAASLDAN